MDSKSSEDTGQNLKNGKAACSVCGHLSENWCERCREYYCSKRCQYYDWPNHRYICVPMPKLVSTHNSTFYDGVSPAFNTDPKLIIDEHASISFIMRKLRYIEDKIANKAAANTDINTKGQMNYVNNGPKLFDNASTEGQNVNNVQKMSTSTVNNSFVLPCPTEYPRIFKLGYNRSHVPENVTKDFERALKVSDNLTTKNKSQQNAVSPEITDIGEAVNQSPSDQPGLIDADDNRVILCVFRLSNLCAVRGVDEKTEIAFRAVTDQVNEYGKKAPAMKNLPQVGSYAITLYSNKRFVRVTVLKVLKENCIRVYLCDYGSTLNFMLTDLRVISNEVASLPNFVSTVQLYGVDMLKYTDGLYDFLKEFEQKEYKIKYIKMEGDTSHVELYDIKTNQILNNVITEFCTENDNSLNATPCHELSIPNANQNTQQSENFPPAKSEDKIANSRCTTPPFKTHLLTESISNAQALVVDADLIEWGYMACVLKQNVKYLTRIQNALNKIDFSDLPYEPSLHEYCVAKCENEWHRGRVVRIHDGGRKFAISYTDFLNGATLTSDHIRPYPEDLKIDCYTNLCKIDNLPRNLSKKQREFLKSKIGVNDFVFIDRVVSICENVVLIECENIIADMYDKNQV